MKTLLRSTLAISLLAAAACMQPAHAGLLGHAGIAGGGSFGPRTLDVGGAAAGSLQRMPAPTRPAQPATQAAGTAGVTHDAQGTQVDGAAQASRGERSVGAAATAQTSR
jgi:hypothetical protein